MTDQRHDRSRRDDTRDRNRLSRSRSPASVSRVNRDRGQLSQTNRPDNQRRYRDNHRDRDGGRDGYRRRDRSVDRRDDDYHYSSRRDGAGGRDRRRSRSRDRVGGRPRSPDRHGPRSRDGDSYRGGKRDDSRERYKDRRDGATDSRPRSRGDDARAKNTSSTKESEAAKPTQAQTEAEKKAERLRKLQAWKEKVAAEEAKKKEAAAPVATRNLLAEMDQKSIGTPATASPSVASPAQDGTTPQSPKESLPYAGKFDPKAIVKAKSTARSNSPKLGDIKGAPAAVVQPAAFNAFSKASKLDKNKAVSGFGFAKSGADADKLAAKRKLDLDDEVTTKRKLLKLPDMALEETDGAADTNQDEEDEGDDGLGDFEGTEEEAAAAARAAHERREERRLQESMAMETDDKPADTEVKTEAAPEADKMEVDEEDEVDPLDAFMAGLDQSAPAPKPKQVAAKPAKAPEAYFSDDDYGFGKNSDDEEVDPKAIMAMAKNRKKKDIPTIDFSKLDLKPVRKNFWHEPYELSQLTEEEANDLRLELDGIKVSGKNIPKPVQKWSHCGLTRPILDTIEKLGYEKPTPIQMQALPVIMSGRDVVAVAKTGSGKTMAFLLPMFRHIMDQDPVKDNEGPIALVLAPTRELCVQIHRDCKPFLKALGLRAMAAYGGAPIKDQIAELKRGAEIVVATVGRLIDLLAANQGRVTNLKRATFFVLDEADRMFDMGFEPQVMKIFANVRPERQTILFSATMPRIIDSLTKKVLKDPVEITVGGRSVVAKEITQIVEVREEKDKFVRTLELLGELYKDDDDVRSLIFVDRQEKADDVLRDLLRRGYGCMSLHGGKDQSDRDSTIHDFKAGICPILVATSVAARGLDVKQLKLVINYDAPNHMEDYVHRAGRTGRAGNTGTAVTFVTPEQENCAVGIAKALELSGQPVPEKVAEMRKSFLDKVKEGKAKNVSGFGGKGLETLDKKREAARLRERKSHKTEDGEDDVVKDDDKEDDEAVKKAETAIRDATSAIQSRDAPKPEVAEAKPAVNEPVVKPSAAVPGKAGIGGGGAVDKAASAISAINARLGLRPGQTLDNKRPDAGAHSAILEINDFPQKARWAVTNRTNVAKILEMTGTSITTKGTFYPAGKSPGPGDDRKLCILIEGDTEVQVGNALAEMTRLLKEGTIAAADAEGRAPASGRYTVT